MIYKPLTIKKACNCLQLFAIVVITNYKFNYTLSTHSAHTQLTMYYHVAGVGTFKPAHDVINFCHFSAIITATSKVIDMMIQAQLIVINYYNPR